MGSWLASRARDLPNASPSVVQAQTLARQAVARSQGSGGSQQQQQATPAAPQASFASPYDDHLEHLQLICLTSGPCRPSILEAMQ